MRINGRLIIFTFILVAIATACKYFFGPDLAWSGFSPVIAIALFSGFILKQKDISFLLPLIALFISDVAIHILYSANLFPYAGFYDDQFKNYLFLLAVAAIGWLFKGKKFRNLFVGGLVGPTVYFLVSNFSVWLNTTEAVYARSINGLVLCYEAGLPFYRNSLIATLVFLPVILFSYNYLTRQKSAITLA